MKAFRDPRAAHRPLSADELGAWRRFLKKADRCARDPLAQAESFQAAAERVGKKLRLPPGQHRDGADLVALIRLGRTFLSLDRDGRAAAGSEIARLTGSARMVIDAAMDGATGRAEGRERRDIFG